MKRTVFVIERWGEDVINIRLVGIRGGAVSAVELDIQIESAIELHDRLGVAIAKCRELDAGLSA